MDGALRCSAKALNLRLNTKAKLRSCGVGFGRRVMSNVGKYILEVHLDKVADEGSVVTSEFETTRQLRTALPSIRDHKFVIQLLASATREDRATLLYLRPTASTLLSEQPIYAKMKIKPSG
jgi:hypothetical protein